MDASLLLIFLTLGQFSPTSPSAFSAPPGAFSGQFVPQPKRNLGVPTPAEPPAAAPKPAQPAPAEPAQQQPTIPRVPQSLPGWPTPDGSQAAQAATPIPAKETAGAAVPAMARQPVRETETNASQTNAAAVSLLEHALQSHAAAVEGSPVSLRAVIDRPTERAATVRAIKAYWQLAMAVADHHHAVDEVGFLSGLASPADAVQRAVFESEVAAARARQAEAELALVAAQQDLSDAAPAAVGMLSPLPSDLPFVGAYRTNFGAIFAGRSVPPGVKRIDRTLPVFERLIGARASAVGKGTSAMLATTDAYQRGEAGFPQVMEAFLHLRQQRIAFLAAVRDYNYSIADYAMSVASPELGRDAIVSMLIESARQPASERSVLSTPRGLEEISPRRTPARSDGAALPAKSTTGGSGLSPVPATSPAAAETSGAAPVIPPPASKTEPSATAPQLPSRNLLPGTFFPPASSPQPR